MSSASCTLNLLDLPIEIHFCITSHVETILSLAALSSTCRLLRAIVRSTIIRLKGLYIVAACGSAGTTGRLSQTSRVVKDALSPVMNMFNSEHERRRTYARRYNAGVSSMLNTSRRSVRKPSRIMMLPGMDREHLLRNVYGSREHFGVIRGALPFCRHNGWR